MKSAPWVYADITQDFYDSLMDLKRKYNHDLNEMLKMIEENEHDPDFEYYMDVFDEVIVDVHSEEIDKMLDALIAKAKKIGRSALSIFGESVPD